MCPESAYPPRLACGWWFSTRGRSASPASMQRAFHSRGGSPAFLSWLPRTMTISSAWRASRHAAKRSKVLCVRPAALWRKSPRKITLRARVLSMALPRRSTFSAVVPDGNGIPARRKLAALPRWKSATKSVRPAGQYIAFSARRTSGSPTTLHSTIEQVQLGPEPRLQDYRGGLVRDIAGRRRLVEFDLHAPHAIGELLVAELLAKAAHHDRKGEGRRLVRLAQQHRRPLHSPQSLGETRELELAFEPLALRLPQQRIGRIPAREHLVDESARRLHLSIGLGLPRVALEYQAGDARDLAKLALRKLRGVQAREHVLEQVLGREEARLEQRDQLEALARHELEAVVGETERESSGARLREAMREERREPQVHGAALERIEEDVVSLARLGLLHQHLVAPRHARPRVLQLEQPANGVHLGLVLAPLDMQLEQLADAFGDFARQRTPAAIPSRDDRRARLARPHVRRHVLHADEFEEMAREDEVVAVREPRDERFLDVAQPLAAHVPNVDGRV